MSGFGTDGPMPSWLTERFDDRTALPKGPLADLPIPLEGRLVRGSSCEAEGRPNHWTASAECHEYLDEVIRFFEEYLPLAGYAIMGIGTMRTRRRWNKRSERGAEIFVIRRGRFLGTLVLHPGAFPARTLVEAGMGDPGLDLYRRFSDTRSMRKCTDIRWRHE